MSAKRRLVVWVVGAVAALVAVFWWAQFYTDWLWYRHDAFPVVFRVRLFSRILLFAAAGCLAWLFLSLNLRVARRSWPTVLRPVPSGDGVDPELMLMLDRSAGPLARWVPVLLGVVGGLGVAESWQMWLLALYGQPFGVKDPQFGLDLGFYVYRLGAWRSLLSGFSSLTLVALVAVTAAYAYGRQIRSRDNELTFTRPARGHLLRLFALLFLLRGALLWLRRYELLLDQRSFFPGAGWTDTHVTLPGLAVAALLAVAAAVACLWVCGPHRAARPAYYAVALWFLGWIVCAGVLPVLAQRLLVKPNEIERESRYIDRAIKATRAAFGLEHVDERSLTAAGTLTAQQLGANPGTIDNIRIWDHRPLLRTYAQLQEIRQYYDIVDIDSDRYSLAGQLRQVLVAARELNADQLDAKAKTWINQHLEYTHGYGLVMSAASRKGPEGQPEFLLRNIPPVSPDGLKVTEPRIYFGEVILMPPEMQTPSPSMLPGQQQNQPAERPDEVAERTRRRLNSQREPDEDDYLIVGTTRDEFDYAETVANQEVKHRNRYDGRSGIPLGGRPRRLVLALRLHSPDVLMSDLIKPESRILLHRQVTRRCQKAAPFLQWDTNPYPIVVNGRIYFVCEGYTLSQRYPYSEIHYRREETPRGPRFVPTWNYLRNPVKAVVDAYQGTIDFYQVDPHDPLANSFEIRAHFRYPVLMFETQADIYRRYHMQDPGTLYAQEDQWAVAREVDRDLEREAQQKGIDPKKAELYRAMAPYYITMSLPDEQSVQFMLLSPFTPFSEGGKGNTRNQRDNLIAWMTAGCDPQHYGRLVVYKFPKDTNVYGPLQVEARINQDDAISQQVTLWDKGGSRVVYGNLLVVPIASSLVYVQPLYLESEQRGLPELKRVIVSCQDKVVMEPTLAAGLERLFGPLPEAAPLAPAEAPAAPAAAPAKPLAGVDPALVREAQSALRAADQALRSGDWTRYDREFKRLRAALERLGRR
ncbi:MAG: UPF0182 family protein [Armatimonadetes bacterium]|nr:UPF0182 family protein [Armatimonadota bacterium]